MSFKLHCHPSGSIIPLDAGRTLLEQLLARDISTPFSCRNGNCFRCDAELLSGSVITRRGELRSRGHISLCTSFARSDLHLQLPSKPDSAAVRACQWQRYSSEQLLLTLPAGRQPELQTGRHAALLLHNGLVTGPIVALDRRRFTFSLPTSAADSLAGDPTVACLFPVSRSRGNWQLWRQSQQDETTAFGVNLHHRTASTALAFYRQYHPGDRWWLERSKHQSRSSSP